MVVTFRMITQQAHNPFAEALLDVRGLGIREVGIMITCFEDWGELVDVARIDRDISNDARVHNLVCHIVRRPVLCRYD